MKKVIHRIKFPLIYLNKVSIVTLTGARHIRDGAQTLPIWHEQKALLMATCQSTGDGRLYVQGLTPKKRRPKFVRVSKRRLVPSLKISLSALKSPFQGRIMLYIFRYVYASTLSAMGVI